MKLLFATTNQNKLREAEQLFSDGKIQLLSVSDFKELQNVVIEESGETFEENAFLKAKISGDLTQFLTIAEDAGLVVDALDGKPGVHSARFGSDSAARNQKLLKMMKDKQDRSARFISVFCLYDPQTKKTDYFRGEIEGQIASEIRGSSGFDYDYVFIPEGYDQTFAELGVEVKNKISHRHQAVKMVVKKLV